MSLSDIFILTNVNSVFIQPIKTRTKQKHSLVRGEVSTRLKLPFLHIVLAHCFVDLDPFSSQTSRLKAAFKIVGGGSVWKVSRDLFVVGRKTVVCCLLVLLPPDHLPEYPRPFFLRINGCRCVVWVFTVMRVHHPGKFIPCHHLRDASGIHPLGHPWGHSPS